MFFLWVIAVLVKDAIIGDADGWKLAYKQQ